ncbi:hypothetical protein CMUST_13935 [Corynebacterium mustelae]|uniref:Uncharacterized protein n=1 Tax=Corynebacterium mustelae TaxID=571915 RepID=A0A0G3H0Z4_9CORY|nr:hypothetical protein CMUST_13935 [Corynebacterium mustelae]
MNYIGSGCFGATKNILALSCVVGANSLYVVVHTTRFGRYT